MPIERNQVLLKSGNQDEMGARSSEASKELREHKNEEQCSLHHILPWRYPFFVGYLAEKFKEQFFPKADRYWPTNATDDRSKAVAKVLKVVSCFGSEQWDLPIKFGWMAPNLFLGPAGNFRIDDPQDAREQSNPVSMRQQLWDQLIVLGDKIDELAELNCTTALAKKNITVGEFDDLLALLSPISDIGHGNALGFESTDWLCLVSNVSNDKRYLLNPWEKVTTAFKDQFREYAKVSPDKIDMYRPDCSQLRPLVPVIWRLRKETEGVPDKTFMGPQLKPI
jgi:hypothetical protein